jgi:hypothetical protein
MAMTYAQNYGKEKFSSELLFLHMTKQAVSSPGIISYLYDKAVPSYLFIRNQSNLQFSPTVHVGKKSSSLITTREQLMLISSFFGFSKSKLGEIFGVTRQSVHNWFNNSEIANEHYKKIKRLTDVVCKVDPEPSQQIFHIYINDVINGYDKSLFDYLLDDDFDNGTVIELSKTLYEMSKERWKRIDVMPKAKYGSNELTGL